MGYKQTAGHRPGRSSYHQVGLVRGQFGDVDYDEWIGFIADAGFDGWEEASWELELERCSDDEGAAAYAGERVDKAKARGLEIFSISGHLQGQALGDEPSAKTLQFIGGEAVEAYKEWRKTNEPPRTDPFYVPDEVGRLIHSQALESLLACARLAGHLGRLQERKAPVSGFTGSPAHAWSHWFEFPPPPSEIGGCPLADPRQVSLELIVERFAPLLELCREYGTTFDLECHPSERAMGDIESAGDYLQAMIEAGYEGVAGFNLDCSHLEWQNVSGVEFIREFGEHIHCAHIKGVQVIRSYSRGGRLGGHRPMGHRHNGWNFVTAGSARDAVNTEEVIVELNRAGFDGALTIEWEDNDADKKAGAIAALANVRAADLPPSFSRHDETLKT